MYMLFNHDVNKFDHRNLEEDAQNSSRT